MISVLLADDQAMVRAGFRLILSAEPDINVAGEAADGVEAVAAARRLRPDVTLMDVRMPRLDGIAATRQLLENGLAPTRVVVLTTFDVDSHVYEALRAGASGFLLKNAPPEDLVQAIRVVAAGAALLDPAVTRRVIEEFARNPATWTAPEMKSVCSPTGNSRCCIWWLEACPTRRSPRPWCVSEATVKTHVAKMLDKLRLRDRVQAVVYAYEHGLVRPGNDRRDHLDRDPLPTIAQLPPTTTIRQQSASLDGRLCTVHAMRAGVASCRYTCRRSRGSVRMYWS